MISYSQKSNGQKRFFQPSPVCVELNNKHLLKIIVQRCSLIDSSRMFGDYLYNAKVTILRTIGPSLSLIPMALAKRSCSLEKTQRLCRFWESFR